MTAKADLGALGELRYPPRMIVADDEDGYATFVSFHCPACARAVNDPVFVPDASLVERNPTNGSTESEADVQCGWCNAAYRLRVRNATGRVVARLIDHPNSPVLCTDALRRAEFDDLLPPWEMAQSPSDNLVDALKDVEQVIRSGDAIFYVKALSRMAFIQQFAALEAYLADTLSQQVLDNPAALGRALTGVRTLKDIKLTLTEVAADPDIVRITVARALRSILFHDFAAVDEIWKIVLEGSIFPDPELKARMFRRVQIRHDCVHRNGRSRDGEEHVGIDFAFVLAVGEDIHAMMMHIEDALTGVIPDDEDPDLGPA